MLPGKLVERGLRCGRRSRSFLFTAELATELERRVRCVRSSCKLVYKWMDGCHTRSMHAFDVHSSEISCLKRVDKDAPDRFVGKGVRRLIGETAFKQMWYEFTG